MSIINGQFYPHSETSNRLAGNFFRLIETARGICSTENSNETGECQQAFIEENFLTELMAACSNPVGERVMTEVRAILPKEDLQVIKRAASQAETNSEKIQAERILNWFEKFPDSAREYVLKGEGIEACFSDVEKKIRQLERFYSAPFFSDLFTPVPFARFRNYRSMSAKESCILKSFGSKSLCITFAGSGPLDLTADLLIVRSFERGTKVHVTEIDVNPEAISLAKSLHKIKVDLGILPPNSKNFMETDVSGVKFSSSRSLCMQSSEESITVECDVLYLGAMIESHHGSTVLKKINNFLPEDRVTALLLRAGNGMIGDIFYSSCPIRQLKSLGWNPFCVSYPRHVFVNDITNVAKISVPSLLVEENFVLNTIWCFRM
jgi:hypothetical protein